MIFVSIPLLFIFYIFDYYVYKKENLNLNNSDFSIKIDGKFNLILILFVILTVVISGIWKSDISDKSNWFVEYGGECMMTYGTFFQVTSLLLLSIISLKFTPGYIRKENDFYLGACKRSIQIICYYFYNYGSSNSYVKSWSKWTS